VEYCVQHNDTMTSDQLVDGQMLFARHDQRIRESARAKSLLLWSGLAPAGRRPAASAFLADRLRCGDTIR